MKHTGPNKRQASASPAILRAAEAILLALALLFIAVVVLLSYTSTGTVVYSGDDAGSVVFSADLLSLTLPAALVGFALLRAVRAMHPGESLLRGLGVFVCALLAFLGMLWAAAQRTVPAGEQSILFETAAALAGGDTAALNPQGSFAGFYFALAPWRLGALWYLEAAIRLLGETWARLALPVLHCLLLASGYGAALLTADRLFHSPRVTFAAALLLLGSVQPFFAAPALDGLIPAIACALWAVYFAVRLLQNGRWFDLAAAALFCALAVTLWAYAWVVAASVCAALVLRAPRGRTAFLLAACAVIAAAGMAGPRVCVLAYESRTELEVPPSGSAALLRLSGMTGGDPDATVAYLGALYEETGGDPEAAAETIGEDIARSKQALRDDPAEAGALARFRLSAVWNEPTYRSLWVSRADGTELARSALIERLYTGRAGERLTATLGLLQQICYTGAALGVVVLLRRRDPAQMILPLALLLGGVASLLFGGGGMAGLFYLPLLVPLAAFGTVSFGIDTSRFAVNGGKRRVR